MKRSKWKFSFINDQVYSLRLKKINEKKNVKSSLRTDSRSSTILPFLLDTNIGVHNGFFYTTLEMNKDMVGHKFGEFVFTRKSFRYGKKSTKN